MKRCPDTFSGACAQNCSDLPQHLYLAVYSRLLDKDKLLMNWKYVYFLCNSMGTFRD